MYKRQWMKHIPGKSVYYVCHYCLHKCLCYCLHKCLCYCLHDCRTCPTPHLRRCALGYGLEKIQRHLELDLIRSRLAAARDCLSKPHVRPELKQHKCKSKRWQWLERNNNHNESKMITNINDNHLHRVCWCSVCLSQRSPSHPAFHLLHTSPRHSRTAS